MSGFPDLDKLIENTRRAQSEAETREVFDGFKFQSTKSKWEAFETWKDQHTPDLIDMPTIGDLFTYEITPTSLGIVVTVRDNKTKDTFELTDWGLFG